jgi:hypothetical protein
MSLEEHRMPAADAGDIRSPGSIVTALYDVISGPAKEERDWDRFRSLFLPGARVVIAASTAGGEEEVKEWDVEEFVDEASKHYRQKGFWERQIAERTEQFGNIAHVFSSYESRYESEDSDPIGRGINSIQLLQHRVRWWIVGIVFDIEGPQKPIPERYLL